MLMLIQILITISNNRTILLFVLTSTVADVTQLMLIVIHYCCRILIQ